MADRRDLQIQKISIHAPRAGSDMVYVDNGKDYRGFQSTLPVRGATGHLCHNALPELISIHAPRAGSDGSGKDGGEDGTDFNPRSPCGERPWL